MPCPQGIDACQNRGPAQRGGAFAPYKRFAAGKTLAQGQFICPEQFKIPRYPKRNTSRQAGVSFWIPGDSSMLGRSEFALRQGFAPAAQKRRPAARALIRSQLAEKGLWPFSTEECMTNRARFLQKSRPVRHERCHFRRACRRK